MKEKNNNLELLVTSSPDRENVFVEIWDLQKDDLLGEVINEGINPQLIIYPLKEDLLVIDLNSFLQAVYEAKKLLHLKDE